MSQEDKTESGFSRIIRKDMKVSRNPERWMTVFTIVILSLTFVLIIAITNAIIDPDPDPATVAIGLIPVVIALVISGRLALTEVETPTGYKLLFEHISESEAMDEVSDSVNSFQNRILEVENEIELTDENINRISNSIEEKGTNVLSISLDKEYSPELIDICMKAIANDKHGTIRYILFTERNGEFAGILKLSRTFRNGMVIEIMDEVPDSDEDYIQWEFLTNREILDTAGVINFRNTIRSELTRRDVLRKMDRTGRDWLPVVNEDDRFVGVVTHNQIVTEILLAEDKPINT